MEQVLALAIVLLVIAVAIAYKSITDLTNRIDQLEEDLADHGLHGHPNWTYTSPQGWAYSTFGTTGFSAVGSAPQYGDE